MSNLSDVHAQAAIAFAHWLHWNKWSSEFDDRNIEKISIILFDVQSEEFSSITADFWYDFFIRHKTRSILIIVNINARNFSNFSIDFFLLMVNWVARGISGILDLSRLKGWQHWILERKQEVRQKILKLFPQSSYNTNKLSALGMRLPGIIIVLDYPVETTTLCVLLK